MLFLEKRTRAENADIQRFVDALLLDRSVPAGRAALAEEYARSVHGLELTEYFDALRRPHASAGSIFKILTSDYYDLRGRQVPPDSTVPDRQFVDRVLTLERDRILAYRATVDQTTIVINAPKAAREEQEFLGYDLSSRRSNEGISYLSGTELIETPLFDPVDSEAQEKFSTLIRRSFTSEPDATLPDPLSRFGKVVKLQALIPFTKPAFDLAISQEVPAPGYTPKVPAKRLGEICTIRIGATPSRKVRSFYKNGKHLWLTISDMTSPTVTTTSERITDEAVSASSVKLVKKGTLLLSFKLSIGRWTVAGADMYTNEAIAALEPKAQDVPSEYLIALVDLCFEELVRGDYKGAKKIGKSMNRQDLMSLLIPVPETPMIKEILKIYNDHNRAVEDKRSLISSMLWHMPSE